MMGVSSFGVMARAVKCCEISGCPARGVGGGHSLSAPQIPAQAGRACPLPTPFFSGLGQPSKLKKLPCKELR